MLNMEPLTRIVFWIVTLFFLQARSYPVHELPIGSMRAHVKCLSDSKFYTPKNEEKRCIATALDCVMRELDGTVREECTDDNEEINKTLEFIENVIKERTPENHAITNSSECACENWSQNPFGEFLDKVNSLLMFANDNSSDG